MSDHPRTLSPEEFAHLPVEVMEARNQAQRSACARLEATQAERKAHHADLKRLVLAARVREESLRAAAAAVWSEAIAAREARMLEIKTRSPEETKVERTYSRTRPGCKALDARHAEAINQNISRAIELSTVPEQSQMTSNPAHPAHALIQAELHRQLATKRYLATIQRNQLKAIQDRQAKVDAKTQENTTTVSAIQADMKHEEEKRDQIEEELTRHLAGIDALKMSIASQEFEHAHPPGDDEPKDASQSDVEEMIRKKIEELEQVRTKNNELHVKIAAPTTSSLPAPKLEPAAIREAIVTQSSSGLHLPQQLQASLLPPAAGSSVIQLEAAATVINSNRGGWQPAERVTAPGFQTPRPGPQSTQWRVSQQQTQATHPSSAVTLASQPLWQQQRGLPLPSHFTHFSRPQQLSQGRLSQPSSAQSSTAQAPSLQYRDYPPQQRSAQGFLQRRN